MRHGVHCGFLSLLRRVLWFDVVDFGDCGLCDEVCYVFVNFAVLFALCRPWLAVCRWILLLCGGRLVDLVVVVA